MIDKSSNSWIDFLQDLNFKVGEPLNTSELWVYLITKIVIYVVSGFRFLLGRFGILGPGGIILVYLFSGAFVKGRFM